MRTGPTEKPGSPCPLPGLPTGRSSWVLHGRACLFLLQRAHCPHIRDDSGSGRQKLLGTFFFLFSMWWGSSRLCHIQQEDCVTPSLWQASTTKWEGLPYAWPLIVLQLCLYPWSSQGRAAALIHRWPSVVSRRHSCTSLVGRKPSQ